MTRCWQLESALYPKPVLLLKPHCKGTYSITRGKERPDCSFRHCRRRKFDYVQQTPELRAAFGEFCMQRPCWVCCLGLGLAIHSLQSMHPPSVCRAELLQCLLAHLCRPTQLLQPDIGPVWADVMVSPAAPLLTLFSELPRAYAPSKEFFNRLLYLDTELSREHLPWP